MTTANPLIASSATRSVTTLDELKPHIIYDLGFTSYTELPYVNHSRLKFIRDNPYRYYISTIIGEDMGEESDATEVGIAAHILILEPENYLKHVIEKAPGEKRTSKKKREAFEITASQANEVRCLAQSVAEHRECQRLLADTERELTIVFEYEGVWCKARIDAYNETKGMVDYKTTRDASPRAFAQSYYNYGYFTQAAFYKAALEAVGKPCHDVHFVVGEKGKEYPVSVFRSTPADLRLGDQINRKLLMKVKSHMLRNTWPSYVSGVSPIELTLKQKQYIEADYGIK